MNRQQLLSLAKAVAITAIFLSLLVAGYFYRMAQFEAGIPPSRYPGDPDAYKYK